MLDVMFTNAKRNVLPILEPETDLGRFQLTLRAATRFHS